MTLKIEVNVLDDLCSRFLLNIPQSEKEDMTRLCFQIELAHWFYLDFFRPENASLPDCRMREFAKLIFDEYPFLLNPTDVNVDEVLEKWKEYKRSVPTYGAILLDKTLEFVLLVQGFWIKASWGFPKGKVNKAESPDACAAREVLEETGYNITGKIDKTQYAEHHLNEQLSRLYFVTDVPMDTAFKPKTRGEIKSVQWFNINDLPAHKKDTTPKHNLNMAANCFFMVIPFVKQIRRWIATKKVKAPNTDSGKVKSDNKKLQYGERGTSQTSKSQQSKLSSSPTAQSSGRLLSESAKRQMQQFGKRNNQELDIINSITSRDSPSMPVPSHSPQQRRKGYGRGRGDRFYRPPFSEGGMPMNPAQSRGRSLYSDNLPDAWRYFTFDRDKLTQAINYFPN